jgi:tRNA-(ms[2]io[6]A)-hydroxylase
VEDSAGALGRAAHASPGVGPAAPLVDRLLVGALIEARSCERFKLLSGAARGASDAELGAFWGELLAAEAGHYRTFVQLAEQVAGGDRTRIATRLDELAHEEATIVKGLARRGGDERAYIHG